MFLGVGVIENPWGSGLYHETAVAGVGFVIIFCLSLLILF